MSDAALPHPSERPADGVTRLTRALALGALMSLIVLGALWELWLAPTGSGTLALKVLPLLPCLPGIWRFRMRTYRALSLLVWLYFAEGAVRASSEIGLGRMLAGTEVALSLVVFAACAWHVRWRLKAAAA